MKRLLIAPLLISCMVAGSVYQKTPLTIQKTRPAPAIIHPELIRAIIHVESRGNPKAISRKGAYGLMQVRWSVWGKELKREGIAQTKNDLFHPEKNIRAGKYILAKYIRKHGNVEKALKAYSGGAKRYAQKVKKYMKEK